MATKCGARKGIVLVLGIFAVKTIHVLTNDVKKIDLIFMRSGRFITAMYTYIYVTKYDKVL